MCVKQHTEIYNVNNMKKKSKKRKTNMNFMELIKELEKARGDIYLDITRHLSKPKRKSISVNVGKIGKIVNEKEKIVVPGKVLGNGEIKKPVNVYAYAFSREARKKITDAKGKCMTIDELLKNKEKARIVI